MRVFPKISLFLLLGFTLILISVISLEIRALDHDQFHGVMEKNASKINERLTEGEMIELTDKEFTFHPIGVFHSPLTRETGAPRQGRLAPELKATIEIAPAYEDCLKGLEAFSHIYVIFVFDRSRAWSASVTPPDAPKARGLFSTRSPNRPNPIGITAVRLIKCEGRILHVSGIDAFDQTPVLDIKPYVASIDCIPDANKNVEKELGLK